jgi:PAS domain S-box-containing protein
VQLPSTLTHCTGKKEQNEASTNVGTPLRQLGPVVGIVLVLTAVGFVATRAHGESDARHDSSHRAEIAATRVHDHVAQASALLDGVRRFLSTPDSAGATSEQFADIGARWLGPVGLPAAAWIERVPGGERAGYERRTGRLIVVPTSSGGIRSADLRPAYLPATLVTGSPPLTSPGIDLGSVPGVAAAVARPETTYRVRATPLTRLPDGTSGLFLVQSAQRLNRGVVEPGFVALFVPASWLLAGATDTAGSNPGLQVVVGGASSGEIGKAATVESRFAAAGQPFAVRVPQSAVHGASAVQPWLVGGAGLMLAVLAGALRLIATRRARAKAELDRIFTITPDLIVVAGFDGYFKRVNPSFETLLGYTETEALCRPYLEFVHPDDRELTIAQRDEIREGETTDPVLNRYVCKDGSYRWIEWTATPVHEERLSYAVGRDVTERHQSETEQTALRRIATLVAEGVRPGELFSVVSDEVDRVFGSGAAVLKYEHDDPAAVFVGISKSTDIPIGTRWTFQEGMASAEVYRTGRSARVDAMDWTANRGPLAAAGGRLGIVSTVASPIVVEGRLWGALAVSSPSAAFPLDTAPRLEKFTEIVATAIANAESREARGRLDEQQAALRRVATLVAEGVPPSDLFAVMAEEIGRVCDVPATSIVRYEPDGTATELANYLLGSPKGLFAVGVRMNIDGVNILRLVRDRGEAARIDDYSQTHGEMADTVRATGIKSTIGVPVVVGGCIWGTMVASTTDPDPLPQDTASRMSDFTELLATAIENAESRETLEQLAEQQAALRRMATLVAEGVPPAEIFAAVSDEVGRLFACETAAVVRFENDPPAIVVVGIGQRIPGIRIGTRTELDESLASTKVYRTHHSARIDTRDWSTSQGPLHAVGRRLGLSSTVASPIMVEGRLWGTVTVSSKEPLPPDTEGRMERFAELVATAIANAESKSQLAASRRRIVAAGDDARRRIERDLHDGTQQRLVSLGLAARAAEANVPGEWGDLRTELSQIATGLADAVQDLQEISRGIHPVLLSHGGLGPALKALARRSGVPVEVNATLEGRLPEEVEVAAYYVVSEALTNAAKHAHASAVYVDAVTENGSVQLAIRDNGLGGADPVQGSGLVGLADRVEALGGTIAIESPPGAGTSLRVRLPLDATQGHK